MSKELISEKFPQYDDAGRELVRRAYLIAAKALEGEVRSNGHDFIEHPLNVALIASDEIGLTADCIAAVFLHEATRKHPELDLRKGELCGMSLSGFPEDVYTMVAVPYTHLTLPTSSQV